MEAASARRSHAVRQVTLHPSVFIRADSSSRPAAMAGPGYAVFRLLEGFHDFGPADPDEDGHPSLCDLLHSTFELFQGTLTGSWFLSFAF